MKKYQKPQAHHWVVLRLARQLIKTHRVRSGDAQLSAIWLVREVGGKQVVEMIQQLEQEEDNNVR
jgi:hypothetical protein